MNPYRAPARIASDRRRLPRPHPLDTAIGLVVVLAFGAIAAFAMACFLSGCAALTKAENAAKLGSQAMQAAEPVLVAAYQASQEACFADPSTQDECIREVRAQFEPIISSIKLFHQAYCDLADSVGAAECRK